MNGTHKQIFIVITQTGTMLSRILKRITGAEYNHASLSLDRKSTRLNSSHVRTSRMPSSA